MNAVNQDLSIVSIGNTETETQKSNNGAGTRRSRKDRSGGFRVPTKNGSYLANRQATTPHVITSLQAQKSALDGPSVRKMPGSDAISLELNIKGMTEPNKVHPQEEYNEEASEEIVVAADDAVFDDINQRGSGVKRTMTDKSPALPSNVFRGALNSYVQNVGSRSRTPLINQESYTQEQSRLAQKIMRPVQLTQQQSA